MNNHPVFKKTNFISICKKNFILKHLNLIKNKEKQINFLKKEISFKRVENKLTQVQLKQKIKNLYSTIQNSICSDLPNAFGKERNMLLTSLMKKIFQKDKFQPKLDLFK